MSAAPFRTPVRSLLGLRIATDFPFEIDLPTVADAPPDLVYRVVSGAPLPPPAPELARTYESPVCTPDGEARLQLFREPGRYLLRLTGRADFIVSPGHIECRVAAPEHSWLAEIAFLGTALSLWLEGVGVPALHGSAVEVEGQAVGFLAPSTTGKSTFAASWVAADYPLLTDDVLAVDAGPEGPRARSGYPLLRLGPDSAHHLGFTARRVLPRLHTATDKLRVAVGERHGTHFVPTSRPLARLYFLGRTTAGAASLQPISPRDAVLELIRHSFAPRLAEALGYGPARLAALSAIAATVPVARLSYPTGFDQLARVRDLVRRDLQRKLTPMP